MRTTSWRAGIGAALMAGALAAAGGCATAGSEQAARAPTVTTSQGAEGNSAGGMEDVSERALEVLKDQGITVTSTLTAPADAARVVEGQKGDMSVRVSLTEVGPNRTHVEVDAQKVPTEWDKDYAAKMVRDITKG